MREVKFRWIDKHLINLTLQAKFRLLILAPLLFLFGASLVYFSVAEKIQTTANQQSVAAVATVLSEQKVARTEALRMLPDTMQLGQGVSSAEVAGMGYSISISHAPGIFDFFSTTHTVAVIVLALVCVMMTHYITSFIGGALYSLNQALVKLAEGDLTNRLNYIPAPDEFSLLAITTDKISERQQELAQKLAESSQMLGEMGEQLSARGDNSVSVADEQNTNLSLLASATEEMAASIATVATHAKESSDQTRDAQQISAHGREQVSQTLVAMAELSKDIQQASIAVGQLDESAGRIDDIVTTINGISEQTNLLALNAAIEAARAGQQGRGFAVVADEVRTLAGRTQTATIEIQQMIEIVQSNSQQLITTMNQTVQNAQQSEQLMSAAEQEISQVSERNQIIAEGSSEIATAAEQQGVVAAEIANNVDNVRQQSNQIQEMIQQTTQDITRVNAQAKALEQTLLGLTY